jgi:signal transduction histidine kinase/DNA-binding response OmpR family regulator
MNYYVAIPFTAVLVNVISTTYIFAQNRKDPVNEAYILLSVFFIGWMFFDILHWSPINPDWILPLLRMQSFFWLLTGFMFTHFTYIFLRTRKDFIYYLIMVTAMASVPVGLTSSLVIKGHVQQFWGTAIEPGPLYVPMVTLVVLIPFVYSLAMLLKRMIKTDDFVERNQCRLILFGTALAVLLTFTTIIILPYFFGIPALPLTHFSIMLHLLFVFAAIVKYKFLAIGIRDAAQDIFSSVKDGVVLLSKLDEVIQINKSAKGILEIDSETRSQTVVDNLLGTNINVRNLDEFESEYSLNGSIKHLRLSRSPLRQNGQDIGSILFISDITSKKHAEYEVNRINADLAKARDAALAASKAKSQFLANMSHELRTPLNAIIGYSEMLREEATEQGHNLLASDLKKINGAGHHLLGLINDILDLSKIEAGKVSVFAERMSVSGLVSETLEIIQPMAIKNSNQVLVSGAEEAGEIVTDVLKLKQILYNLLSNACKFTQEGEIRLDIRRRQNNEHGKIVFSISDSGIGLNEAEVDRLFEYFSQADPSTTRQYGGSGLGLAISKRFCELMGGNIGVSSTKGVGSIFEVSLPVSIRDGQLETSVSSEGILDPAGQTVEMLPADSKTVQIPVGTKRVLIIDDDPSIRELLTRYLAREGFVVFEAENGDKGIEIAEKESPNVIILDVMMPGTDGWSVLEHLKSHASLATIPVIMLTMVDDRTRGYALGALHFFNKPVNWTNLYRVVNETLGQHQAGENIVLVVDDDPESRSLLRHSLEKEGWRVEEAHNGRHAIDAIHTKTPSLILLDLMMPEMDGFEFVDEIRSQKNLVDIPIIVLTAMDIDGEVRDKLHGQVQNILVKGAYDRDQLLRKIGDIIG